MSGKRLYPLLFAFILLFSSLTACSQADSRCRHVTPVFFPQISRQPEPDLDGISPTEQVYRAWTALAANPLSKNTGRLRQTLYENLPYMDWPAYGALGEAGKETETIMALLTWLDEQDTLSRPELTGLLLGAAGRSNLDGAYADSYSYPVTRAFIAYPIACCEILAGDELTDRDRDYIIGTIAYGAYPENVRQQALTAAYDAACDGRGNIMDIALTVQTRLQEEL